MESSQFAGVPPEIIELILQNSVISLNDVCNMRLTCRYMNDFIMSRQTLWKNKLLSEWPFLKPPYMNKNYKNWYDQCRHVVKTEQYCQIQVMGMSSKYRWRRMAISNTDLVHYLEKAKENDGIGYYCMMNCLRNIFEADVFIPDNTPATGLYTFTNQHYAKIVYNYLFHQYYLKNLWNKLMIRETSFVPDLVAKFVIQWLYPRSERRAFLFINYIDYLVKKIECELLPNHPLMKIPGTERENWMENLLEDNQLSGIICKQLMASISHLIFDVEFFHHRSSHAVEALDVMDMINYQNSHKYLTYILYEAVARRCGIRCDITGSGNHLFLHWRENWSSGSPKYIVDIVSGRLKISTGRCPFAPANSSPSPDNDKEYSAALLLTNIAPEINNIIHVFDQPLVTCTLELLYTILPDEIDNLKFISHMYVLQKKDVRPIIRHIMEKLEDYNVGTNNHHDRNRGELLYFLESAIKEQEENEKSNSKQLIVKRRMPNVKFAIGMVCHHKLYQYKCVLTGWDYTCKASQEWQRNMGVYRLSGGPSQPFYHALAEDGSQRYVAQENLEFVLTPYRLKNVEEKIGIDFSHFNGHLYIPNKEMQMEYPDDPSHSAFFQSRMTPH